MLIIISTVSLVAAYTSMFDLRSSVATGDTLYFAAVIDAGSTGSRLNVVGFSKERIVEFYYVTSVKPGIAAMATSNDVEEYLERIFSKARSDLKRMGIDVYKMPIALQATAGLRLLPDNVAKNIIDSSIEYLKRYRVKPKDVGVITGATEGMHALRSLILQKMTEGWAINRFGCEKLAAIPGISMDRSYCNEMAAHVDKFRTYGIIDMGGGSVQVSFIDDIAQEYTSKSYLGLGLNEGMKAIHSHPMYRFCRSAIDGGRCSAMFDDLFKESGGRSKRTKRINRVDEVYLVSYFYEKFDELVGGGYKHNLSDIRASFKKRCENLMDDNCVEVEFMLLFLKYLDFEDDTPFFLIKKILGVNLTWTIAKAYDMLVEDGVFD